MIVLTARNVWRQFDAEPVLRDVCFELRSGERIGLVGPNGAGKTTLLRLLAGKDEPDKGSIDRHPSATVALLEQQSTFEMHRTVLDVARQALEPLLDLEREALAAAETLARSTDAQHRRQLERRYDRLQHELHRRDAYHVDRRVEEVLEGLRFERAQFNQPAGTLSGGQQSRLMLARLLLASPTVLLLDEPSNHLDLGATVWLEQFLIRSKQAAVVVSHDRYFLDKVTARTLELVERQVDSYTGNFTAYWRQREERVAVLRKTYDKQQQYIAKQEAFVRRYHYGQRHAQAKDRQKKIERIERVEKPREIRRAAMGFAKVHRAGDWVLEARGVAKGFDRTLFEAVDLQLARGERLGIVGPNGSGKTTMLRILLGETPPDTGTVRRGANVDIGYFDQQLATLPENATVLDALRGEHGEASSAEQLRGLLARFGLDDELVEQRVANLSGGEKSRLALARLAESRANLLVLDEPTNHLDLWARASLEESLNTFEGTIVFVSHDRYFLNRVADRLLVLEPNEVRLVEGNYDAYLRLFESSPAETGLNEKETHAAAASDLTAVSGSADGSLAGRPRRTRGSARNERSGKARRRFPYRTVEDLEEEIAEREAELRECQTRLAAPATYQCHERGKQVRRRYEELQCRLQALYAHWEEAMELN